MKMKPPFEFRWTRCSVAGLALLFLAVSVMLLPRNAVGQQQSLPKLTLSQVEQLVSHSVPDSVLAAQIQRRGLAFAPSPTLLDALRAKGAGPLTLAAIEARSPLPSMNPAIPAKPSRAPYNATPGNLSQQSYVDRDCDGTEDGRPGSIFEDLSQQDVDSFSVALQPGCFSGYILLPQSWEYYHMQAAGSLDNWWLAYKWYVSKNSSSGQRPPLQAGDLVSMTHGSHKIRVQGNGQLLFLRTPPRAPYNAAPGNLSQQSYVDRDCDGTEDGQPGSIFEDLSQQDIDSFSVALQPGCFSGYILIPQSWEYYHMQAADPLDNWWLAYKWYVSKNSSSGQRPPLQASDLAGMTHGSHKIRVQGNGQLLFLRTPPRAGTEPLPAPVQQTNGIYHVGGRVSAPVLIHSVEAQFSDAARRAKYQGDCLVSLIVDTQGNPQNIRVTQSLDMGLDEKAIEAVRQYRFKPAMLDGATPVPVAITVKIGFHLY